MKATVTRLLTTLLTSDARRDLRRALFAARRRVRGAPPTVVYFHQPDDPYSHLASQLLGPLAARYRIRVVPWIVPPPDEASAPERERLRAYALRDAARLAAEHGLTFPEGAVVPEPRAVTAASAILLGARRRDRFAEVAPQVGSALFRTDSEARLASLAAEVGQVSPGEAAEEIALGARTRRRRGHYLGAMLSFEGEWYWGVDRLHHLEARLQGLGLDTAPPGTAPLAPCHDVTFGPRPPGSARPTLDLWFSFRSPYSYIVLPRVRRLARHYGAELRLRFILPMVMRGLPVPWRKSLYIMLDTKREADRVGLPFGAVVDPRGAGIERSLAVLHHAVELGKGEEFAERALQGAFAKGIDLASEAGLLDVARSAGLSGEDVRAALADEGWRAVAETNRRDLLEAGLWGAPTCRVNGMPAHWGQDRLWAVEEDLLRIASGGAARVRLPLSR